MVINSYTILTVVSFCLALYFSFRWGQQTGYNQGVIDGRIAVRKYYEQVGK